MADDIHITPPSRAAQIAHHVEQVAFLLQLADELRTPWERLLVSYAADLRARRLTRPAGLLELSLVSGIETEDEALAALERAGLTPSAAAVLLSQVER